MVLSTMVLVSFPACNCFSVNCCIALLQRGVGFLPCKVSQPAVCCFEGRQTLQSTRGSLFRRLALVVAFFVVCFVGGNGSVFSWLIDVTINPRLFFSSALAGCRFFFVRCFVKPTDFPTWTTMSLATTISRWFWRAYSLLRRPNAVIFVPSVCSGHCGRCGCDSFEFCSCHASSGKDRHHIGCFGAQCFGDAHCLARTIVVTIPHVQPHAIVTATLPLISRVLRAVVTSVRGLQESNNNTDLYEGKKERLEQQGLLPTALPVTNAHKRLVGPAFEA